MENSSQQGPNGGPPRRSKACEYCRSLKVRCIPSDAEHPSKPCLRCVKSKKECIFHLGPRKRTRKTDSRVAALEKKVEVLTAALSQHGGSPQGMGLPEQSPIDPSAVSNPDTPDRASVNLPNISSGGTGRETPLIIPSNYNGASSIPDQGSSPSVAPGSQPFPHSQGSSPAATLSGVTPLSSYQAVAKNRFKVEALLDRVTKPSSAPSQNYYHASASSPNVGPNSSSLKFLINNNTVTSAGNDGFNVPSPSLSVFPASSPSANSPSLAANMPLHFRHNSMSSISQSSVNSPLQHSPLPATGHFQPGPPAGSSNLSAILTPPESTSSGHFAQHHQNVPYNSSNLSSSERLNTPLSQQNNNTALPSISSLSNDIQNTVQPTQQQQQQKVRPLSDLAPYGQNHSFSLGKIPALPARHHIINKQPSGSRNGADASVPSALGTSGSAPQRPSATTSFPATGSNPTSGFENIPRQKPFNAPTSNPVYPSPNSNPGLYPGGFGDPPQEEIRNSEFNISETRAKLIEQWHLISYRDHVRVEAINNASRNRTPNITNDIVTQGLISIKEAEYRLNLYNDVLHKIYPVIDVPEGMTVETMRKDMPLFFLTIMATSSVLIPQREAEKFAEEQDREERKKKGKADKDEQENQEEQEPKTKRQKRGRQSRVFKTALTINNQCIDTIMYDVMILGNKTLELLKCLVLINMWYNTPEMYHHQKAHLITHMCITMAFDLGLGGYSTGAASSGPSLRYNMGSVESRNGKNGGHSTDEDSNSAGGLYNHSDNASVASSDVSSMTGSRSESVSNIPGQPGNATSKDIKYDRILRPYMLLNPHSYKCRKLWLSVYICSINVSLVIKRPVYMMWSSYTEECCELLEQHDRPFDERIIAAIARLNHLLEQLTSALQTSDPRLPPDVNDPRTQSLIKYFEWQLRDMSERLGLNHSKVYRTSAYALQLFLHESALYIPYSPDLGRSPYTEYSLALGALNVTIPITRAAAWCHYASTNIIDIFLEHSTEELACAPMFSYSRLVLAVSILLKLRTLYLSVPTFRTVCTVTSQEVGKINQLIENLDEMNKVLAFANCALNYCLVLRILIYHYDRQLHFYSEHLKQQERAEAEAAAAETAAASTGVKKEDGEDDEEEVEAGEGMTDQKYAYRRFSLNNSFTGADPGAKASGINNNGNSNLNILSNLAMDTSFEKRPENEREVILFMQAQKQQQAANVLNTSGVQMSPLASISSLPNQSGNNGSQHTTNNGETLFGHPSSSGFDASAVSATSAAELDDDMLSGIEGAALPSWLFIEDSWKELVSGAEALSGFDMFG